MFTPRYNSQEDIEEYERNKARQRAAINLDPVELTAAAPKPEYDMEMEPMEVPKAEAKYDMEMEPMEVPKEEYRTPALPSNPADDKPYSAADEARRVPALDANFKPVKTPQSVIAKNQVASSVQKEPKQAPKARKANAGNPPPSRIQTILGQVGQLGAQIYGVSANKGSPQVLEAVNQRGQRAVQIGQEDEAARTKYANRKGWLQSKARDDARADAKEERLRKREDKADARLDAADARTRAKSDPASPQNKNFRAILAQEYPEQWAKIPPEQQATITREDAEALGIMTKKADAAQAQTLEETKHQRRRTEGIEDYEKQRKIDKQYRRPPSTFMFGGGGGGYTPGPEADADLDAALAAQFGGAENVPPIVAQKLKMAKRIKNPKLRDAAVERALTSASTESSKGTTADFKERKAYLDETESARAALASVEQLEKTLGYSAEKAPKNPDVPGLGPVESNVPSWVYAGGAMLGHERSQKAQQVRADARRLVAEEAKRLTGLAATDAQYRQLNAIVGASESMSEAQLIEAMKFIKNTSREMMERASRAYPGAAGQFNETAANPPDDAPKAPAPPAPQTRTTVKVIQPNGQPRDVWSDKVDAYLQANPGSKRAQ